MRSVLVALPAAAALAACATRPEAEPTTAMDPVVSTPSPVAGLDWRWSLIPNDLLSPSAGTPRLAYGAPQSGDLVLAIDCRRGDDKFDLLALSDAEGPDEILLESGGDTERYPAEAESFQEGRTLRASADRGDPVFKRFHDTGWMAIWFDGRREMMAAHPEGRTHIARFFADCG